jgi:hypothetical protein
MDALTIWDFVKQAKDLIETIIRQPGPGNRALFGYLGFFVC